jgi:hypothetical protein
MLSQTDGAKSKPRLQLTDFESYKHTIVYYHYSDSACPIDDFRKELQQHPQYNHSRADDIPLLAIAEGDNKPTELLWVAYLPNVFQSEGCAVGFFFVNGGIEWLCFHEPVQEELESAAVEVNDDGTEYPMLEEFDPANKALTTGGHANVLRCIEQSLLSIV